MAESQSSKNKDMARMRGMHAAALVLGLSLAFASTSVPAWADKVGVAAAVEPDAFSSLNGTPNKQLNMGKSIFYNERINTTASGLVQVLLVDGSTFTVGPNSDLVIDKFVYDPNKKSGQIVATFSKGAMRFIGGKISKNEGGVKVNTPAGTLAIRGGMFQGRVSGGRGTFSFLYGVSLTYSNNGHTQTVYEPGYTLDTTSGTPTIRPTTPQDTNFFQKAFSGGGTVVVGGTNNQQVNNDIPLTQTVSLQDLIADANATQTNDTLQQEENNQNQTQNNTNTNSTPTNNTTTTTELDLRVLTPPHAYTAFKDTPDQFTTYSPSSILGGDDNSAVTTDDFIQPFRIVNGRLEGTVTGLVDGEGTISPATVDFPAVLTCVDLVCPVTGATVTQDGQTTTYEGLAALRKNFYAYHLISTDGPQDGQNGPDVILAFGGKGYNFGTPSGRTFGFKLAPDVLQGTYAPFASSESTPTVDPNGPQPFVTPLLYKEADNTGGRPVWLQTSLYINTTPADPQNEVTFDQQSFVNVALGGTDPATGGLVGARRGGANVDVTTNDVTTNRETLAFTGDIASLAGPDGSHFLGQDQPNIVIGIDSTGDAHNIGRDIPLDPGSAENQSGASYHIGAGLGTLTPQPQAYDGEFKGYAAGIYTQPAEQPGLDSTNSPVGVLTSNSPNDLSIAFDAQHNTLSATLTVAEADPDGDPGDSADTQGSITLGFGDSGDVQGHSAYLDNLHYAAIETPGTTQVSVLNNGSDESAPIDVPSESSTSTSYLVSGDQLGVTQYFPDTFTEENGSRPFCHDCSFIKWGAWGTRTSFTDPNNDNSTSTVDVHLGWWVAGDITADKDLDTLAALDATATYDGHVIGDVAYNSKTYTATGDLTMDWGFRTRTGTLTIDHFDTGNFGPYGLTFTGDMCAPGFSNCSYAADGNHFKGTIEGQVNNATVRGLAAGSFVNDSHGNPARGVIGNWNVNGSAYKATGVFAGSGTPH